MNNTILTGYLIAALGVASFATSFALILMPESADPYWYFIRPLGAVVALLVGYTCGKIAEELIA